MFVKKKTKKNGKSVHVLCYCLVSLLSMRKKQLEKLRYCRCKNK